VTRGTQMAMLAGAGFKPAPKGITNFEFAAASHAQARLRLIGDQPTIQAAREDVTRGTQMAMLVGAGFKPALV
jgi:hypothetical protein